MLEAGGALGVGVGAGGVPEIGAVIDPLDGGENGVRDYGKFTEGEQSPTNFVVVRRVQRVQQLVGQRLIDPLEHSQVYRPARAAAEGRQLRHLRLAEPQRVLGLPDRAAARTIRR